jgi:hypothetical protein
MTWRCLFCDFAGDKDELMKHSAVCEKHPLWKPQEADLRVQLAISNRTRDSFAAHNYLLFKAADELLRHEDWPVGTLDDPYMGESRRKLRAALNATQTASIDVLCTAAKLDLLAEILKLARDLTHGDDAETTLIIGAEELEAHLHQIASRLRGGV